MIYLCTKDNQLRKHFKEMIATNENQPMSLGSNFRIYQFGNRTKPVIYLPNCVTCLIHLHGNLCLCSPSYELIALGLIVTAVLSGHLDHCTVSVIAWRKLTSISENTEKPCHRLCAHWHRPGPLWGLLCVSAAAWCLLSSHEATRSSRERWQ